MKKILSLVLILAVVLAMVLPLAVSADTTVNGHVLSKPTVTAVYMSDDSTPAHGLPSAGAGSGNITVHIVGTNFDVVTDYSPNDPMPTIIVTAHGFTATAGSVTGTVTAVTDSSHLTATFVVAAASTSGYYDVQVSQGGFTSDVNYSADRFIVNSYGIPTAPTVYLGVMTMGQTTSANSAGGSPNSPGNLSTNDLTWKMTVADATNGGYMKSSGTPLHAQFMISKDSTPGDFAAADPGLTASDGSYVSTGTALPLYVKQAVSTLDGAGDYSITITFAYSATY